MPDARLPLSAIGAALGRAWRRRSGKVMAICLVLAVWRPAFALLPAVFYGIPALRALMRRLLYSVRAKLAAFYVYAAVLPILIVATVLLFAAYIVLGQTSARVVQDRLERHVAWGDEGVERAERAYWQARAHGVPIAAAAQAALDAGWSDAPPQLAAWARTGTTILAVRGRPTAADMRIPAWLDTLRSPFVGLTAEDSTHLDLRTRLQVRDGGTELEIGSTLAIDSAWLNRALPGGPAAFRGGVGSRMRVSHAIESPADSAVLRDGVVAFFRGSGDIGSGPAHLHFDDSAWRHAVADTSRSVTFSLRTGARNDVAARAGSDSVPQPRKALAPSGLRSRWGLFNWTYIANPVDWETGRPQAVGPPIAILFTIEGTARALLATGWAGIENYVLIGVLVVVAFLILVQMVATLQGFVYARAIANSVSRLDDGVRAIRAGDFGQRIEPHERDQLGGLALAFNDMSERLQSLLEERVHHEAVERELAIARDVQARLFPARMPYAPFLEVVGMCMPARVVSGDSYDFVEIPGGWDAFVADVSGKGMSAALLMASLHSALHGAYIGQARGQAPDPADVVTRLNQHLHQYAEPSRFVTLFMVRYCGDGKLIYCNAGHNPAALVRDGRVQWLQSGGLMLGPFPDLQYTNTVIAVQPGDVVCMYTDGVTEAESPTGEQFGEERLARTLRQATGAHPRDIAAQLQEAVEAWRAGGEPSDDVTIVVMRITG